MNAARRTALVILPVLLVASLEGHRGMPRPRPPFPVQAGYLGKPTSINNVETFANVPLILLSGKDRYRAIGTLRSTGTKVFALAGRVKNTGLVEVPTGTTLRKVIYSIGGGAAAVDAARSALRLGARWVGVLYRRTREEMPANHPPTSFRSAPSM